MVRQIPLLINENSPETERRALPAPVEPIWKANPCSGGRTVFVELKVAMNISVVKADAPMQRFDRYSLLPDRMVDMICGALNRR